MSTNWAEIRREFPALSTWTYLDSATYGQMPRRAVEAVAQHFARRDERACSDYLEWFDDADRLRGLIGQFINCFPEDIAFASSASQALAVLLNGIRWRPGDRIVSLEGEFPNNLYAPGSVSGVEFVQTSWDRFYESVNERTRLVLMSTANYSTGFLPPLEEISRFLHERGVLFYLDGTQSVGALRFDVQRVRPSMLAVHGYKWMLCPTGAAFFYVDPELRGSMVPNVIGWRSDKGWRNVNTLNQGVPEFKDSAERYEGGMIPFALLCAMEASVAMILEIGPERIEARVLELAARGVGIAREFGATIAHPNSHIIAARFKGADVARIAAELKSNRVLVSARHGHLRVSAHFYNDETDLERLRIELRDAIGGG
jgi:cysteine desulfurase / selenocysteine lyase